MSQMQFARAAGFWVEGLIFRPMHNLEEVHLLLRLSTFLMRVLVLRAATTTVRGIKSCAGRKYRVLLYFPFHNVNHNVFWEERGPNTLKVI